MMGIVWWRPVLKLRNILHLSTTNRYYANQINSGETIPCERLAVLFNLGSHTFFTPPGALISSNNWKDAPLFAV